MNQSKKRPLIFISNDDGYEAKGINYLAEIAREYGDVIVVGPDGPRSGNALSVTFNTIITSRLIKEEPGLKVYACSGTPADCTKLGLAKYCDRTPDLVLGGINHGDNSAVNVHYSGTMGIVIEGCLKWIPSIGFSYCSHNPDIDFSPMRPYIKKVIEYVLENGLPKGVCLNVNAPDCKEYKGMKVTSMGDGIWEKEWDVRMSPRGMEYYWMVGNFRSTDKKGVNTDWKQLQNGYVTVTPTKIDVTSYEMMDKFEKELCSGDIK